MKRFLFASTAIVAVAASITQASPAINGAHINPRVYNDMGGSTLTVVNTYPSPAHINFDDVLPASPPLTFQSNQHTWRLSTDGGVTDAPFANGDSFKISADVTITGNGNAEAGLNVSPWWSTQTDGKFHVRASATGGEVAAFGGRLPFYSFGNVYVTGTTATLSIEYIANSNTAGAPGQIQYGYNGLFSPWIQFDQGNPAEDPPHGLYGILSPAYVGGFMQNYGQSSGSTSVNADFNNIVYNPVPAPGTAGLLGLGGLLAARRRR